MPTRSGRCLPGLFMKPNLTDTQPDLQAHLNGVFECSGLSATLDELFKWSHEVGYITDAKLNDNKRYVYHDDALNIDFKTQINIARSNYTPKPLTGKDIPKLHCPICFENVGIPGKEDLRVFEFDLEPGRRFFAQLTPFPLYPQHFVVVDREKNPMRMDTQSVQDMVNFVDMAPEYTACSNSDVEWAGASVLVHHHYQMFKGLHLPIMEADLVKALTQSTEGFHFGILNYPIAACRTACRDRDIFIRNTGKIIEHWKAQSPGKNTCNLVVRFDGSHYLSEIIFRNPDYRTPEALHKIKSEGVGIIEVAGEGIYPVPSGDDADALWKQIKDDGLPVIKGIIAGNNPVPEAQYPDLFQLCCDAL
jgi:galactose-1-phosphate uridylyltransferase